MKAYDDPKAWSVETREQLAAFEELVEFGKSWRQKQHDRAKKVFDAFCDDEFPPGINPDNPDHDAEVSRATGQWRIRLNKAIRENLDHRSIEHFMQIASDEREKIARQMRAHKQHEKRNEIRRFVRNEWATHKSAYEGNKSAFARDYVRRVKHEFEIDVTEKQMREVWLKDTPPASNPDGMPAGGE